MIYDMQRADFHTVHTQITDIMVNDYIMLIQINTVHRAYCDAGAAEIAQLPLYFNIIGAGGNGLIFIHNIIFSDKLDTPS